MRILLLILAIVNIAFAAQKDERPKIYSSIAKKTGLNDSLSYPIAILSKVNSKMTANVPVIVVQRIANLGQKVKKGDPLLVLRNQDTSVHYENRVLRASVDGVVASIMVEVGEFVTAGKELIFLNSPEDLYGKVEIPASDFAQLKTGLKGKISLPSLGQEEILAEVVGVGAVADFQTGTVPVELKILSHKGKLVPGVLGIVHIVLGEKEILMVKEKALYYSGDEIFIAILKDGKVSKVPVKLGERHAESIEIVAGLELGQEYVEDSPKYLRDGVEVEVMKK